MRGWGAAVVAVFLLAGCLVDSGLEDTDPEPPLHWSRGEIEVHLTQPLYDEFVREETVVEGAGGTQIWMEVYRPSDTEDPVPVILVKTPYQTLGALIQIAAGCSLLDPPEVEAEKCLDTLKDCEPVWGEGCPYTAWLVDYFVPRGYAVAFGDVRGNNKSGGCSDQSGPGQWQDGYNMVEWLGAQAWSNGRVGMYGASYDGETQISTALLAPPSLKTIVPTASVSNLYEYSYYDGVPYSGQGLGTALSYLGISLVPGVHENAVLTYPERLECQLEVFQAGMDKSGDWSQFWDERDFRPGAHMIEANVLQAHGLQDWNVKPNHVDGFFNELIGEKRLILGQWGHSQPQREDWGFILHRWFDHHLHGIETGILEDLPPVLTQDSEGEWRGIDSFPPLEASTWTLWPHADGSLDGNVSTDSSLTLKDIPSELAGQELRPLGYLFEQLEGTPDRLVFQTESLEEPLHTTGRPVVHLSAKTDEERTRWAVHLLDVDPDGRASIINRGYFNTRHIDGLDSPGALLPGERYDLEVRLFPQDDVVPAGHKLRLVIMNTDDWVEQDDTYATSELLLGEGATRLILPLAPAGERIPEDRLREGL